jgi:hypothetical protein
MISEAGAGVGPTHVVAGANGYFYVADTLVWFAGPAVAHDLVPWPLSAVADRGAVLAARRHSNRLPKVPLVNHLRVPAVLSGVLLAVSFPLVFRCSEPAYHAASGLTEAPYLGRWLLLTGVGFAVSAVLYAFRVGRVLARKKT